MSSSIQDTYNNLKSTVASMFEGGNTTFTLQKYGTTGASYSIDSPALDRQSHRSICPNYHLRLILI